MLIIYNTGFDYGWPVVNTTIVLIGKMMHIATYSIHNEH